MLLYYFNWSQNKNIGRMENITQVLVEVRKLWDMAGILTVLDSNLKKRMDVLLKGYQSIIKDSRANRHSKKAEQKRKLWLEEVDSLFDCASSTAEKAINTSRFLEKEDKETDIDFLEDQRTARQQYIGMKDESFVEKLEDKDEREKAVSNSVEKEKNRVSEAAKNEREQRNEGRKREVETTESILPNLDPDFVNPESAKKSKRSNTVQLELPKAPFDDPFVAATLDRLKITSNQAVGFFGCLLYTSPSPRDS